RPTRKGSRRSRASPSGTRPEGSEGQQVAVPGLPRLIAREALPQRRQIPLELFRLADGALLAPGSALVILVRGQRGGADCVGGRILVALRPDLLDELPRLLGIAE